jgi:hypothetical protein
VAAAGRSSAGRRLVLRVLGLALVAVVLATQLKLRDRLVVIQGGTERTLEGRVTRVDGGDWEVRPVDRPDTTVRVPDTEVKRRTAGESRVPAVSWGLLSLGARLAQRPGRALEVLLLLFVTYLLTAWRWWILCRAVGVSLSLGEAIRLNLIGAFFNTAVPGSTGGDVVKAWYAARETGRGVRAVLAVFADRVTGLVGLALFATGALVALGPREGLSSPRLIVAAAVVALGGGSLVLLSARLRRWLGLGRLARRLPFRGVMTEAGAALRVYRERPRALLAGLGISLGNHAIAGFCVFLLARGLGVTALELPVALALVPIANLFGAIPLLPGGWGVGEVAFAYLFGLVGVPATEAVSLSIVYRLGMLAAGLPGGGLWLFWRGRPPRADIGHAVEEAEERLEARETAAEEAEEAGATGV